MSGAEEVAALVRDGEALLRRLADDFTEAERLAGVGLGHFYAEPLHASMREAGAHFRARADYLSAALAAKPAAPEFRWLAVLTALIAVDEPLLGQRHAPE